MKLWFIAKNTDSEYLYIKISNNNINEKGFNINEIDRIQISKIKSSLFGEFHKQFGNNIYLAKVDAKGAKYYILERDEIILRESSFFAKDLLKNLPVIQSNISKTDIIKACYALDREKNL